LQKQKTAASCATASPATGAWQLQCSSKPHVELHGVFQPAWRCCGHMHSRCNGALPP
jgi:hypothetical protein